MSPLLVLTFHAPLSGGPWPSVGTPLEGQMVSWRWCMCQAKPPMESSSWREPRTGTESEVKPSSPVTLTSYTQKLWLSRLWGSIHMHRSHVGATCGHAPPTASPEAASPPALPAGDRRGSTGTDQEWADAWTPQHLPPPWPRLCRVCRLGRCVRGRLLASGEDDPSWRVLWAPFLGILGS